MKNKNIFQFISVRLLDVRLQHKAVNTDLAFTQFACVELVVPIHSCTLHFYLHFIVDHFRFTFYFDAFMTQRWYELVSVPFVIYLLWAFHFCVYTYLSVCPHNFTFYFLFRFISFILCAQKQNWTKKKKHILKPKQSHKKLIQCEDEKKNLLTKVKPFCFCKLLCFYYAIFFLPHSIQARVCVCMMTRRLVDSHLTVCFLDISFFVYVYDDKSWIRRFVTIIAFACVDKTWERKM